MSKSRQNQGLPKGRRQGVFGQGDSAVRVGLYARVSTHDQQTLPLQLSAMREYAVTKPVKLGVSEPESLRA